MSIDIIPQQYVAIVRKIASMTPETSSELLTALGNAHPTTNSTRLTAEVRSSMSSEIADLEEILAGLVSVTIDLDQGSISIESFANDAVRAIAAEKGEKERTVLGKRIASLLRAPSLRVSARASRLQREYENVFLNARIVSDIRPVFNSSGSDALGAIVMHNLKVVYYGAEGDSREIFFALDNDDLTALKSVIERAELKTASIERLIHKAGIDSLDPRKE